MLSLMPGQKPDARGRRVPPTVVVAAPEACSIMQAEVFRPAAAGRGYDALDAAIAYVGRRPRPLGLYYFDRDATRVTRVLTELKAGGGTINDVPFILPKRTCHSGELEPAVSAATTGTMAL